ncbi:MAG: two-component regulator propeller domain-containing protein [Sphingobacteriaceae bacterium]
MRSQIVLFFLFLINIVNSQVSNLNELNNIQILGIAKDEEGKLWLASKTGLFVYDGALLIKFNSKSNIGQLKYDDLNGILYNKNLKKIIATTKYGINVFDPYTFKNILVRFDSVNSPNQNNEFTFPCNDDLGNVWFTNQEGFLCTLNNDLKIKKFDVSVPIPLYLKVKYNNPPFLTQLSCSNKKVYFGTSNSIICGFDLLSKETTPISYGNRSFIGNICIRDTSYLFDFNGVHLRVGNDTVDKMFHQANLITGLFYDNEGCMWFVLNKTQLYKLRHDLSFELIYELDINKLNKHKNITSILVDEKRIWLGTSRGLIKLNKPNYTFSRIFRSLEGYQPEELSSRGIVSVSDSTIVCGGYNYLAKYNPTTNKSELLLQKNQAKALIPYCLLVSGDSLWITGEGSGVNLFDLKTNKLTGIKYYKGIQDNDFLKSGLIVAINRIDSNLFFGEYGLLGTYNLYTHHATFCDKPDWQFPWFKDKSRGINQILILNKSEVLIISKGIIYITDRRLHVKFKIKLDDPYNKELVLNALNVMADKSGDLWISTDKGGLCYFTRKDERKKWYNVENGLSDNSVYYSLQSNDGRIWVATNHGLNLIDPASQRVTNYYEEDGIANNEFNTNSFLKASNGDLYFGGMKGVTRIIPSLLESNLNYERFIVTSLSMAGKLKPDSLYLANLSEIKTINLPYNSRYFKITFSLMNFSDKNRYEFRLMGNDSAWINLGQNTSLIFNSLEPGMYNLQIRAFNERGDLAKEMISLPINVEQIFYLKTGFIVSFVLLIIILTGSIFFVVYRIKVKALNQMADMRLKIATDLHDQVGGLLNKTATQAEVAQMKLKHEDNSLTKIADNSRVALHSMRDIMWNLDPRNDDPESLVVRMSEYAQTMLEDSNVYELHLNVLKEVKLPQETRQVIITVFKEAISNIVKHAPNERVLVSAEINKDQLSIVIHNTGSFQIKNEFSGQGLRNMKMRIERIGGQFLIDKNDGVSLTVIIKV